MSTTASTDNGLMCGCGAGPFSNQFYLGKHMAQSTDDYHVYKPDLSDTIEEKYSSSSNSQSSSAQRSQAEDKDGSKAPGKVEPAGAANTSATSSPIQLEAPEPEDDNWRELDPSDPMEAEYLDQGYTEINLETMEVRQ